jgi:CSLREA domain-containing protein
MRRPHVLLTTAVAVFLAGAIAVGTGSRAQGAPVCNLVPTLRDVTINQGLGSYTPLAWGKDTLIRLYLSQPQCAGTGALIQITNATLTISGGGVANRTIQGTTPALVTVFPPIATFNAAPAVDSTGDVKFDAPGATLSPAGTEAGFNATFTATVAYSATASSRTPPQMGTVTFSTRPGTTNTPITSPVAKKTNALRLLVVPMGDPTKSYNTQLTAAGQAEIERGMLTLSRMYPLRDGIASLTDTSATAQAAGLRYSVSPTLLDISTLMPNGVFCGNSTNFTTLRGLLAQFLQAFNTANPATPADRVLGVADQAITQNGCDEGRAAVNGNEAWARLIYDATGAPSRTGALMGMEVAHTMGAVPVGRNDGAFHSLYTNADYLTGDLNRAYNIATRSVLAGTNQDHTVMRFVLPWDNTNTILEKADWSLLLCRFGGPTTPDCATSGTVGTAAAGPAFVMSGTTSGANGLSCSGSASCVGAADGTNVVESYLSNAAAQTRADPTSVYHLVQKRNGVALGAPFGNQGVSVSASDTHHDSSSSTSEPAAGLFSIALPFDTSADRIELWKGTPGATGSLLLYARNTSAAPTVTSVTSGGPPVERPAFKSARRAVQRNVPAGRGARAAGGLSFLAAGTTERVSITSGGTQGAASSFDPSISADGRYVAFITGAALVADDTNNQDDAYVRDRQTGTTERVSVDASGAQVDAGTTGAVSISDDGRYVAFTSAATNLVSGDTNGVADTFVKDRTTGDVDRVSLDSSGIEGNGTSVVGAIISGDGRYVAFASRASNLVTGDTNNAPDVFVRDRQNNTTERVSVASGGVQTQGADRVGGISSDGRYVTFATPSTDVVPSDSNGLYDVFLYDRQLQTTERISVATGGAEGTGGAAFGTTGGPISSDGNLVAFQSDDTNLVTGDDNGAPDVFVRDRTAGTTTRADVSSTGTQANNGATGGFAMSDDGKFVTFSSAATNLVGSDTNGATDVFLRDQSGPTTEIASLADDGTQSNGSSTQSDVSNDGRFIAFSSDATNLITQDTNSATDVFVRDRSGGGGGGGGGGPFVVNTTADGDDGTCDATNCTLREAINAANNSPNGSGPDDITFAIAGSGPQQIAPTSELPKITEAVVIDGDTERTTIPGIAASTKAIVINGDGAGSNANGLTLLSGSGGSTIKGLAINNFQCGPPCANVGYGVILQSDGNTVTQNYIGLLAAGDTRAANKGGGILVTGNANIIGDDVSPPGHADLTKGNVISGNNGPGISLSGANNSKITGNLIGTNAGGAALGNTDGISVASGGANTLGPENTIAQNTGNGIFMGSATNRVVANSIHDNTLLGIDNAPGAVPFSVTLASAVSPGSGATLSGTVSGAAPGSSYFIEVFDNAACDPSGFGEGQRFVNFGTSQPASGSGNATFSFTTASLALGDIATVTATTVAASPSTSEFSNCRTVRNVGPPPPGQQQFDVGGSDADGTGDDVLDLFLDCGPGKGKFPIALALPPNTASGTAASWTYNYDPSLACEGGQLKAVINDGFRQSGFTATGTEPVDSTQKDPFSAILSPGKGATFLQYSGIPLKGLAFDAEDGALTPHWRLIKQSDSSVVRTATGSTADLSPPASGWATGQYTVELTATDSAGRTTSSTVGITIVADADNDGIPASVDGGCLGGSDTDPLNAYLDKDGDGIPNADDPDPCNAQTGAYNAIMTFQPTPFPVPSSGNTVNVTVQVPYRNLAQVGANTVKITAINGAGVTIPNMSWKVTNNVGQALFDRQALITYFSSHNIHNQTVVFTISGSSAVPPWSFTGVATTSVNG